MATITIGGERTNVTLHAHLLPRPDPGPRMMQAKGSFCAGRLNGEFDTLLESPERFIDELSTMAHTLKGDAYWHGVDDDVRIHLQCKSLGAVDVEAKFHDFSSFDATIRFDIDQSYLPPIIASLRSTLSVQQ